MAKWDKKTLRMDPDHGRRCKPGTRSSSPTAVTSASTSRPPGSSVTTTQGAASTTASRQTTTAASSSRSSTYLPPGIDWSELPIATMLHDVLDRDDPAQISRSPIAHVLRPGLEIVWTEVRRTDPNEKRGARSRHLLARGSDIQPFITVDYWPEDAPRFAPVWDEVVRSLRVGEFVTDPRRGPQKRGRR